jgi:hypothetical protein
MSGQIRVKEGESLIEKVKWNYPKK